MNKQDYGILTKSVIYCLDKIVSIIDDGKNKDDNHLSYLDYQVEYGKRYNCSRSISYYFKDSNRKRELYIFVLDERIEILVKIFNDGSKYDKSVVSIKKVIRMKHFNELREFYLFLLRLSNCNLRNYIFYESENYILGFERTLLNNYYSDEDENNLEEDDWE